MARPRRVFIVSEGEDTGGVAIAIKRAFERASDFDYEVRAMRGANNYIDYPTDLEWDRPTFEALWDWADIIHSMEKVDNILGYRNPPGKPVVLHHHGQTYRGSKDSFDELARRVNIPAICSTIDLAGPDVTWVPNPVDIPLMASIRDTYRPHEARERLRFVHSPTAWRGAKGTDQWERAVARTSGELKITEKKTWAQNLADKATGDVHLDQLLHCYGNSGIEAMAMALPVLSGGEEWIEERIIERAGYLPYHPSMGRVDEAVAEIFDPDLRSLVESRGWQYVNDFHSQGVVTQVLHETYQEALDVFQPGAGPW